jgi:chromosome segregation ATPase
MVAVKRERDNIWLMCECCGYTNSFCMWVDNMAKANLDYLENVATKISSIDPFFIHEAVEEIKELRKKNEELTKKLDNELWSIRGYINCNKGESVDLRQKRIDELEKKNSSLEETVENLTGCLVSSRKDVANLIKELDRSRENCLSFSKEVQQRNEKIVKLEEENESLKKLSSKDIVNVSYKLECAEKEVESLKGTIRDLTRCLGGRREEIERLKDEDKKLEVIIQEYRDDIRKRTVVILEQDEKIKEFKKELEQKGEMFLSDELDKLRKEKEELNFLARERNNLNVIFLGELNLVRTENDKLKSENKKLKEELQHGYRQETKIGSQDDE